MSTLEALGRITVLLPIGGSGLSQCSKRDEQWVHVAASTNAGLDFLSINS